MNVRERQGSELAELLCHYYPDARHLARCGGTVLIKFRDDAEFRFQYTPDGVRCIELTEEEDLNQDDRGHVEGARYELRQQLPNGKVRAIGFDRQILAYLKVTKDEWTEVRESRDQFRRV